MLIKRKTFRTDVRKVAPLILKSLCCVSIIAAIVLFSKYTHDATSLRNWKSDKNDFVSTNFNMSIYQIISEMFNSDNKTAGNNDTSSHLEKNKEIDKTGIVSKQDHGRFNGDKNNTENTVKKTKPEANNNRERKKNNDVSGNNSDVSSKIVQSEKVEDDEISSKFRKENDEFDEIDENDADDTDDTEIDHTGTNTMIEEEKEICRPEPPKDDFSKCGNRIADIKCCEYIWALKYKDDLIKRSQCNDQTIIGGVKVLRGEFPHMAAVGFRYKENKTVSFKCGGTLISESFVLTAGHCTKLARQPMFIPTPQIVRLGVENIMMTNNPNRHDVVITKIYKHPKYKPPIKYYDVALLELLKRVRFTYTIHPACLSTKLFSKVKTLNVTGWGGTEVDSSSGSDHLLVGTLNVVDHDECDRTFTRIVYDRNFPRLNLHLICAGSKGRLVDTCKGDSGSPLQERIKSLPFGSIHRVHGVTAFGYKCGTRLPGVYVRVAAVMSWIENIVWPESKNSSRNFGVL